MLTRRQEAELRKVQAKLAGEQAQAAWRRQAQINKEIRRYGIKRGQGKISKVAIIDPVLIHQGTKINKGYGDPEYIPWVLKKHPELLLPK
jgi:hypothetical protein